MSGSARWLPARVLLVEDDPAHRRLLIEHLRDLGVDRGCITEASTLALAREHLASHAVDCVLVDLSLPDATGIEGVSAISRLAPTSILVVVTGNADGDLLYAAMAAGADEYLRKQGLGPSMLADVLARAERRRAGRASRGMPSSVTAIETVPGPAAALDSTGRIVAVNRAWNDAAAIGGARPEAVAPGVNYLHACERATGPQAVEAQRSAAGLRAVLSGETATFNMDYRCDTPDAVRWFTLRVTAIGLETGSRSGAIVTHAEITELKLAELSLGPTAAAVDGAVAATAPIFAVVDAAGTILRTSEQTRRTLGLGEGDLAGTPAFAGIDPHDQVRAGEAFAAVLERPGASRALEVRVLDGAGRWRDLEVSLLNLSDDPDVGGVVIFGAAISRSRRERLGRALELGVLRHLPVAVVVADDRGVVAYWNERATTMFGWSADDVVGRPVAELGVSPRDGDRHQRMREQVRAGHPWEGEYRVRRSDGTSLSLQLQLQRIELPEIGFRGVVAAAIDVSAQKRLEKDLKFQALHDPLTGLANRRLFTSVLEAAIEDDRPAAVDPVPGAAQRSETPRTAAVLFVDLDDFGELNERLGHTGGDRLLRRVASTVSVSVRPDDTVGRLGGDEFVVCCPSVEDAQDARRIAERILDRLRLMPTPLGRPVSASIGIALGSPGIGADAVLRNADIAMYNAKELGKGRVEVFDDDLHARVRHQNEAALRLQRALLDHEIEAHFQPQFDLADGRLVGFEALARWISDDPNAQQPLEFVAIAEQSGLIHVLGQQMLDAACSAAVRWREERPDLELVVSVNVSARQLEDPDLPASVRAALGRHGLPPDRLCLEVTESALTDHDTAACALASLKDVGVQIAVDDFGSGYSSLSRLHRFPLDHLKIDRTFVNSMSHPGGEAIVRAVLHLAETLQVSTVAEGIETAEQQARLQAMGWTLGQGFLWSPAVPSAQALALVLQQETHEGRAPARI